jgi:hypothetical protein
MKRCYFVAIRVHSKSFFPRDAVRTRQLNPIKLFAAAAILSSRRACAATVSKSAVASHFSDGQTFERTKLTTYFGCGGNFIQFIAPRKSST